MLSLEKIQKQLKTIDELKSVSEALEQIAAADMLEVRKRILASRAFFDETWKVYGILRQLVPVGPDVKNKHLVVLITPNRGMCGNLLGRVITTGEKRYKDNNADLLITGRKGHSYFANKDDRTIHFFSVPNKVRYEEIEPLKRIIAQYAEVQIVFPRFYNTTKQEVEVVSLLADQGDKQKLEDIILPKQFRIEPDIMKVVNYFNQAIVGLLFYNYFSESLLAYSAAQMIAMRNAHDNAKEEEEKLMYKYHKQRREVIDVKLRDLHKVRFLAKTK